MQQFDIAIVGGGILGLAHAWMALQRGLNTILLERDFRCQGASIRNFGMVWPIGQPNELYDLAIRSRQHWMDLGRQTGIYLKECGSLHLARHEDELAVLEEYVSLQGDTQGIKLITPKQVESLSSGARTEGLLAAMWSGTELCVNPVKCIDQLRHWLVGNLGLSERFGTNVINVDEGILTTSTGEQFRSDRIIICSGSDFETLFPQQYADAGLKRCKLQMMATACQPNHWQLGPHLAGGLTLRHYRSFEQCGSINLLKKRIQEQFPRLDQYGIHVMASQNDSGQIVLGDSHEYEDEITPFDSAEIENLMLEELKKMIQLPDFEIARRWHGVYAKHPEKHIVILEPQPDCRVVTAPGGAGMTLSFGIAESHFENW